MPPTGNDGSTQPDPSASAPTADDALAATQFLGKKWKTLADADKGVAELTNYASGLKDKTTALERENQLLQQRVAALAGVSRPDAQSGSMLDRAAMELAVDKSLLTGAFTEFLMSAMEPVAQSNEALSQYAAGDETFAERQAQVLQFRDADPKIKAQFHKLEQGDALGAWEWLDAKFIRSLPDGVVPPTDTRSRVHGGLPSTRAPESRKVDGNPQERLAKAQKYADDTGNTEPLREAYLDQTSGKQEFLRQLHTQLGIVG